MAGFPAQQDGVLYLTEGGQETEAMYRHGHDLPEFALFALLDRPDGLAALRQMYASYLDTAAATGSVPLIGGLDYRVSPDWVSRLGLSVEDIPALEERCIDFLREVAEPYRDRVATILYAGIVGPWGDAYTAASQMTADEAADYHSPQVSAMAAVGVDLVEAMTFGSVEEAIGVARAAYAVGLPSSVSFTLGSDHRLLGGATLREAIEAVDREAGDARPDFYGINCSHPLEFEPALEPGDWVERIRILRPNASSKEKVALCQIGHLEEGDPPALGALMGGLARRYPHLDIWGGCCGTWDTHLGLIARAVDQTRAS